MITEGSLEVLLTIYEVNSDELLDEGSTLVSAWPSGLPHVDGVFVCYDASHAPSFKHVVGLLSM